MPRKLFCFSYGLFFFGRRYHASAKKVDVPYISVANFLYKGFSKDVNKPALVSSLFCFRHTNEHYMYLLNIELVGGGGYVAKSSALRQQEVFFDTL